MTSINRRELLRYSALGLGSLVVSTGLTACGGDDDTKKDQVAMSFSHGVASGDPLADSLIIWTRALPDNVSEHPSLLVQYEVAADENFNTILHNGQAVVDAETDFTLKVDAKNLQPATSYFYRFHSNGKTSPIGRGKTLPAIDADVERVKLAVVSCSNYPAGFFNVYAEASTLLGLDAVVHLGDYIYEYKMGEYATEQAVALGRALPQSNDVELITLQDYRARYALYREDAALLELHRLVPMIVVPDDHEVADDSFNEGALNHNDGEGDYAQRKLNALKAYFEWLPIRPANAGDERTIYRQFQWGNLLNLMMLDTRLYGRAKQLSYSDARFYNADNSFNAQAFIAAVSDPAQTMLGDEQLQWCLSALVSSPATWQVLGQQVLMARMNLPAEVLFQLAPGADVSATLAELAAIKVRMLQQDSSLTQEQIQRVLTAVPYNLDAWDGYAYEREVLLGAAKSAMKNLVVLAGDTHNAWASNLTTAQGEAAGVEFATCSVSSPGMETYLSLDEASAMQLAGGLTLLIDDLKYSNLHDRGLMVVDFSKEKAQAEWIFVDTVLSQDYNLKVESSMSLSVNAGAMQLA